MRKLKVGFIGAGSIAHEMAKTIDKMDTAENYAVAARDGARAAEFAKTYHFAKSFGSYGEMLRDGGVDLVYINTVASHHYEQMMLCLDHKTPVLCEKPFTANAREAEAVLNRARKEGVLVTEAIWTRYMPFSATIGKLLDDGAIGTPRLLSANLGYHVIGVPRLKDPALAGGSLVDIGVYPINFASMYFGTEVVATTSTAQLTDTGVDATNSFTFTYADGKVANLYSSMAVSTNREGVIYGDKGFLVVDNINNPLCAKRYNNDRELQEEYNAPPQISGYEYQVEAAARAIAEGRTECSEMPHAETLRVMGVMDGLRKEWGVRFPTDER